MENDGGIPKPLLPKSAIPLGSRGSGGRGETRRARGRRATTSAPTQRMTVPSAVSLITSLFQYPFYYVFVQVCSVSPGRVLELSATPTAARYVDMLGGRSHDSHMIQQRQLSASLPGGGFLRSARLRPLGIVDAPRIRADECLGIVSGEYFSINHIFLHN